MLYQANTRLEQWLKMKVQNTDDLIGIILQVFLCQLHTNIYGSRSNDF